MSNKINKNSGKYFFYAGNAYPHKNLERLIEAISELNKSQNSSVFLKIASSRNAFTERLQKVIEAKKADECVKLLGFVPDSEMEKIYENSVGFVFPSLSEGFGLPGIEAMRAGTLVLCSDIPVFREIYQDNAFYFDPLNVDSIVQAMEKAVEMKEGDRKEKIEKSQKFVKRYSWTKMAEETLKLYESCDSLRSGK